MATLKVTISEELTLNGVQRGSSRELDISSVTQIDSRIVTVTTTEADIVKFDSAIASGTFVANDVKYLRISNTNSSGDLTLRILGSSEEYFVEVGPGESFILNNALMDANATGSQGVTLADIAEIKADASTGTIVTEVFVAS